MGNPFANEHLASLMQKRYKSIGNALELYLFYIKPSTLFPQWNFLYW